jgi:hypothetical protein
MKAGDLVRLNEKYLGHPAYRNGVLYLVSKVHSPLGGEDSTLVELYTPEGKLTAFDMGGLEVVSESR